MDADGRTPISRDSPMFMWRNPKKHEMRLKRHLENLKNYNLNPDYNLMEHMNRLSYLQLRTMGPIGRFLTPEENKGILFYTLPKFWKDIAVKIVADNAEISYGNLVKMLKEKWIARDIEHNVRKSFFLRMNPNMQTLKFSRSDKLSRGLTKGVTARIVADYMRDNNL